MQDNTNQIDLTTIPANRRLVETLFEHGIITTATRRDALELLYPARNWGLWVSRLLLALGTALVLSGIVYFFAFNWAKVPIAAKFGAVEAGLFGCVIAAYLAGLRSFPGKLLLLSASVLVGVFMAVFGQIYQTGADAYTLFMMWALVILPWVVIGEFAPLWVVWLAVVNLFITLYWQQAVDPSRDVWSGSYVSLALFNSVALGLREGFVNRWLDWLGARWTRFILVVPILTFIMPPTIAFIFSRTPSQADSFGVLLSIAIHAAFFLVYRFRWPDIWALTATLISACIVVEFLCFKVLSKGLEHGDQVALFLLMGLVTLGMFTLVIIMLRAMAAAMEAENA